jgi:hypothetical protein
VSGDHPVKINATRLTRRTAVAFLAGLPVTLTGLRHAWATRFPALDQDIAAEIDASCPALVTREQWHAKPPLPGMKPQVPRGIIIHHTAVRQNPGISIENKMRNLQSFSQQPGQVSPKVLKPAWPDVPYHYYIDNAGRIAEGRDVRFAGDTNTKYDTVGHIQLVLEGDFEIEHPTSAQVELTRQLLAVLTLSWDLPVNRISVHKDHAPTTCPGRHLSAILPELLANVAEDSHHLTAQLCRRGARPGFVKRYCQPG